MGWGYLLTSRPRPSLNPFSSEKYDLMENTLSKSITLPKQLATAIQVILTALVPILLVLISVRFIMTETWLKFEYNRAGFPEDLYGWDKDVRLEYGPYGIQYLLNDADISYLGELEIEGQPAFREKELDHMEDVKVVVQGAMLVLTISLILFVVGMGMLAYSPETRPRLLKVFMYGGASTLITIVILVILVFVSWDFFFDTFHALFFSEGTWQFYRDDTLIRLYPQQFWFDSSLAVGILTISGALTCILIPLWRLRRQ